MCAACLARKAQATLLRALPLQTEIPFPPEAPAVAALTHALRAKFDPRGVFNQGMRA